MKRNAVICPPCGESVALATKEGQNKEYALWPLLPRLTAVLPPQGREITTRGFTLIELLVVVLIIGILAAIAMPQYQKAVEKSRVAEALTTLDTLKKAIDVYVLEHGLQNVTFIGKPTEQRPQAQLDIDIPLDCNEDGICNFGKYYRYLAACTSSYCYANAASKELSDESVYVLFLTLQDGTWGKTCYYDGEKAEQICNNLSGLGWEPEEN